MKYEKEKIDEISEEREKRKYEKKKTLDDIKEDPEMLKKFKLIAGEKGFYWQRVPEKEIDAIIKEVYK